MKIKLVSDLHLEFNDIDVHPGDANILILSGDILLADSLADFPPDYDNSTIVSSRQLQAIRFRDFLRYCSEDFEHVIYVAGNHEFYHYRWHDTLAVLRRECSRLHNVHFLENDTFEIADILFVGATLWTNFNNYDPTTIFACTGPTGLNDYQLITNEDFYFKKLKSDAVIARHKKTIEYFDKTISNTASDKKVVVVSHHAPTLKSIAFEYRNQTLINGAYASDLSNFILDHPNIALWTHGHIHESCDYMVGNTRIVCNPRGYTYPDNTSRNQTTNWNLDLIIEV